MCQNIQIRQKKQVEVATLKVLVLYSKFDILSITYNDLHYRCGTNVADLLVFPNTVIVGVALRIHHIVHENFNLCYVCWGTTAQALPSPDRLNLLIEGAHASHRLPHL